MYRTDASRPAQNGFLAKAAQLASGHAAGYVLTLGAAPLLARLYGPAAFGVFAVFVTAASCLAVAVTCRFDQAIPLGKTRRAAADTAVASFAAALLSAAALLAFAQYLNVGLRAITHRDVPELLAPLLAIAVACIASYHITAAWLLRIGAYRDLAAMRAVCAASTVAMQIAIPLLGGSVLLGLASGQAVGFAAGTIYGGCRTWKTWPAMRLDRTKRIWQRVRLHRRFAYYGVPAALVANLSNHGPVVLLAALYGVEVAGVFALAQRVFTTPLTLLNNAFSRVYFVEATKATGKDDLRRLFRFTVTRVTAFAACPVLTVAFFAPLTFGWLFGADWAAAGTISSLLAPLVLALTLSHVVGPTFDVLGKQAARLRGESIVTLLIAGGMSIAWIAGASAYVAIAAGSVGGACGYLLLLHGAHSSVQQAEWPRATPETKMAA